MVKCPKCGKPTAILVSLNGEEMCDDCINASEMGFPRWRDDGNPRTRRRRAAKRAFIETQKAATRAESALEQEDNVAALGALRKGFVACALLDLHTSKIRGDFAKMSGQLTARELAEKLEYLWARTMSRLEASDAD
jgi:hypothetical protein